MNDFWSRKLAGTQPPPHVPQQTQQPTTGAWWSPASVNPGIPPTPHPGIDSGSQLTYQQLKGMRADEMSQDQMEQLATMELQGEKYNRVCDACGSDNFIPQGTRVGNARMGTAKCFDCGNSSSTLTQSPEPAVGGGSGKAGKATKQTASGGLRGAGNYGKHVSQLPAQFIPRGGA